MSYILASKFPRPNHINHSYSLLLTLFFLLYLSLFLERSSLRTLSGASARRQPARAAPAPQARYLGEAWAFIAQAKPFEGLPHLCGNRSGQPRALPWAGLWPRAPALAGRREAGYPRGRDGSEGSPFDSGSIFVLLRALYYLGYTKTV